MRTKRPTSGMLMISNRMLPMYMELMTPQNSSGSWLTSPGPTGTPWSSSAPRITAMVPFAGMPSVSRGMKDDVAAALFADSGAATPSTAPCPNRSGVFDRFFSNA
jgi:hypothetical protein